MVWRSHNRRVLTQALEHLEELFEQGDLNKNGTLSLEELKLLMKEASKRFPHLNEHAMFLESKTGGKAGGKR